MPSTPALYRNMDRPTLDAAYNNSLAVADSAAWMAGFAQRSEAVRASRLTHRDLAYGPRPRQRIDYFAADGATARAPLLVFIHGGYWQARSKDDFSFIAPGPLAHGMHVATVGYTLAPEATLTEIVEEVRQAIRFLRQQAGSLDADPDRLIVSGWSAGGHLTALCLQEAGVIGGVAISGIYDLAPIGLCYVNDKLQLRATETASLSPMHLPLVPKPLTIAWGTNELPELQRQSQDFAALRQNLPCDALPLEGCHHFSILEALAAPDGALTQAACRLLA